MEKPAPVDYPVHELMVNRWSPRAFTEQPVPKRALHTMLEAARWAPSCFNEQPWAFLVATKTNQIAYQAMLACVLEGNRKWAQDAPVLMVSLAKLAFERNGKPNRHAYYDVGQAAAQLTLQATALGLAVHQMGGIDLDRIRQTYNLPEDVDPVAGFAIGYCGEPESLPADLAERERAPRTRKPLSAVAFSGNWGEPF